MTLKCGPNEFKRAFVGGSINQATQLDAFNEAMRDKDLTYELLLAWLDLLDFGAPDCPGGCTKKVRGEPTLTATKLDLRQDAQGRWSCELGLELRRVIDCTKEIEVAALPPIEVVTDVGG
jgi:hypothetical protein